MESIHLISLRHSAFYTPYLIAFVAGFLEKQGLNASYRCVGSLDELESALISGQAQVAQSAVGVSMRQIDVQQDIQKNTSSAMTNEIMHFAQINQRDGFFIAAAVDDEIIDNDFNWKLLENKRVIADHLFQPMATLKYVLEQQQVDISSITFLDIGNAEQSMLAFKEGKADFLHLQGPFPQQLEAEGSARIVASVGEVLGDIAYSSLCATTDWLMKPVAKKFMTAYNEALAYVKESSSETLAQQILSQFDNISMEVLKQTISAYKELGTWEGQACISEQSYQNANRVFLHSGDITSPVKYNKVVSTVLC